MCSSLTPSSLFLPINSRRQNSIFHFRTCTTTCISASLSRKTPEFSWLISDPNAFTNYNGWDFVQPPVTPKKDKNKDFSKFVLIAIFATGLGLASYFSLYRKGLKFQFSAPFHGSHDNLERNEAATTGEDGETTDLSMESAQIFDEEENVVAERSHVTNEEVVGRITVPFAADSTQERALFLLKKLEIVEDDVKADELCTRREYARWLVKANRQLERSRKHRIVPSVVLSGSIFAALDDVNVEDPDFAAIQSLAEAGVIPSNLSDREVAFNPNVSKDQGVCFFPNRFLSRQDLICWKAKIEYPVLPVQISRKNVGFLDVKDINSDALAVLFVDLRAGERSILRRVFGQAKRFQPDKPSTKAQAAVSLVSGRMEECIQSELSKLEEENSLRLIEMEEIKSELLERGEIRRFWEGKIEEERTRGLEVEKVFLACVKDLEQEKIVQENALAELLKQKAALDCQKQLLSSLKKEVDEMSEKLVCDKAKLVDERRNLSGVIHDLQARYEASLDAKSLLEAEMEALRKLRSWIEDEAKRSQARAKVLEEVARRWKWEEQ